MALKPTLLHPALPPLPPPPQDAGAAPAALRHQRPAQDAVPGRPGVPGPGQHHRRGCAVPRWAGRGRAGKGQPAAAEGGVGRLARAVQARRQRLGAAPNPAPPRLRQACLCCRGWRPTRWRGRLSSCLTWWRLLLRCCRRCAMPRWRSACRWPVAPSTTSPSHSASWRRGEATAHWRQSISGRSGHALVMDSLSKCPRSQILPCRARRCCPPSTPAAHLPVAVPTSGCRRTVAWNISLETTLSSAAVSRGFASCECPVMPRPLMPARLMPR